MTNNFYFVLIKDNAAKVIHENDFQNIRDHEFEDWQVVWDSALSEVEGYVYAAKNHRCLNLEYQDAHYPQLMTEPKVLYRSVSLPELQDILKIGVVRGKGNEFNDFDNRSFVFFGDQITTELLSQGEDLSRQAYVALINEPVFSEFDQVSKARMMAAQEFYDGLVDELKKKNKMRFDMDLPAQYVDPKKVTMMASSGTSLLASQLLFQSRVVSPQLSRLVDELRIIEKKMDELRRSYSALEEDWIETEKERRARYPFTSAIIQTSPMSHGFRYSATTGKAGMSSDEYGFYADSVREEDIVRIHLVADGRVIRRVGPQDFKSLHDEVTEVLSPQASPMMSV